MLFRVTFSTDIDEYYKKNANDITVAFSINSDSFDGAMSNAERYLSTLMTWYQDFKIVSVTRIEVDQEEDDQNKLIERPYWSEKKTPDIWCDVTGIRILDPDGWRRAGDPAWTDPITRLDFMERAGRSTCVRWPDPLWDER